MPVVASASPADALWLVFSVHTLAMTVHTVFKRAWTSLTLLVASSSLLFPIKDGVGVKAQSASQFLLGMGIGDITGYVRSSFHHLIHPIANCEV